MNRRSLTIAIGSLAGLTAACCALIVALVVRGGVILESLEIDGAAAGVTAATVLVVVFAVPAFIKRFTLDTGSRFPWVIGAISAALAFIPWLALVAGRTEWASSLYRGMHVPQGLEQFWDLRLVLRSVDCASYGFNVFVDNNGCLNDASIYGPGTLWLQYVPFDAFAARNATALGLIAIVISSLTLVWLARISTGRARIVLLVAAVGGPWLLMLERGNFDAFLVWTAAGAVLLVRRWNSLWAWSLAAAAIWLMGTWKYYPFALGLMLLPALRLRRGWMVVVGFGLASIAFVAVTWSNFIFSATSNSGMTDVRDFVVLGRVPLVFRMIDITATDTSMPLGHALVYAVAAIALVWGVMFALALPGVRVHEAMLAVAGSSMFLVSVLVAGFGFAYKAVFLLLTIPLLGRPAEPRARLVLYSSIVMLVLVGVNSTVVWNTVLATLAGIIAAAFAFGASATLLVRYLRLRSEDLPQRERAGLASGDHAVTR